MIADITDFYSLFSALSSGFVERQSVMESLLKSTSTHFYLVLNPSNLDESEAKEFVATLDKESMNFAGVIFNKTTTEPKTHQWEAIGPFDDIKPADLNLWKEHLIAHIKGRDDQDRANRDKVNRLSDVLSAPHTLSVPELSGGVTDLASLSRLASTISGQQ